MAIVLKIWSRAAHFAFFVIGTKKIWGKYTTKNMPTFRQNEKKMDELM